VCGFNDKNIAEIVIPSSYKGKPVTSIEKGAFDLLKGGNMSLTIPESIKTIEYNTISWQRPFVIYCEAESKPTGWSGSWNPSQYPVVWDCRNNDKAEDGTRFTVVDGIHFRLYNTTASVYCQSNTLKGEIKVPTSIEYKEFNYNVTSLSSCAFFFCKQISSIELPNTVAVIGESAFYHCNILKEIIIPHGVTEIKGGTFTECYNLETVTLPRSLTSLETGAFRHCEKLTEINFKGTKKEWNAIKRGNLTDNAWNEFMAKYTIHCTDGDIKKANS
ncbi:MAG: leucine-rich repeat domain-containing protein, partial [Clostridia bacterium]|nr:leucine-rich repeat domain-containing protein [Clostridia bacterium]